jgi:hypothetical protein
MENQIMFSYEELTEIIEKLRKQEEKNCDEFCNLNPSYVAMAERRAKSGYFNSALMQLSYELNEIYKMRRKNHG